MKYYLGYPNHGTGGVCSFELRKDDKVVIRYFAWCPVTKKPWGVGVCPEGRELFTLGTAGWIEYIDTGRAIWKELVNMGFTRITKKEFDVGQELFSSRKEQP